MGKKCFYKLFAAVALISLAGCGVRASKQDAEEKLKSLLENEKQLQDKMHKIKGAAVPNTPEKNW